ncbi:MAG: pyruvate formate lyase family protein [Candidatus Poribacteria bacterium]
MNERIINIRKRAMKSIPQGDPKAGEIHKESMDQTEGEPSVIREAKAIAHYYLNRSLFINDGELVVGDNPRHILDNDAQPAIFGRRSWTSGGWGGITDQVESFFKAGILSWAGNHKTLDYDTVFAIGFHGLSSQIDFKLSNLNSDEPDYAEKKNFLDALKIIAEAYIKFSNRYADYALELSQKETDPVRKWELEMISKNCRNVPANPPNNFWEACQSAWFSFFFVPDAPGRVDQYLYPFYKADIEKGTLTREFAKELVSCLWIRYFEYVGAHSGVSAINHLTLGGMTPDGNDATNEVTEICLDVTEELRLLRPQVGFRWNQNTPQDMLERAVRVLRAKTGNPDFCNDEQIVPALINIGVQPEDARNFSLSGCHEVIVTGMAQMGSVEGFINMPKIMTLALGLEPELRNGFDLSAIDSYESFWTYITDAMDYVAQLAHEASVCRDRQAAEQPGGYLEASLVTQDCIENAKGYTQGGARYNFCNWDVIGTANLADSIMTIQKMVFEDKTLSLQELSDILMKNWEGYEPLRMQILNQVPHFGNNNDQVDMITKQIIETLSGIMKKRTPFRGGEYILGTTAGGENMHIEFGRITNATPDGRKSGTPFADSIGAGQGRDRHGITAILNSVAKLPHKLLPTATTLNVKLDPKLLDDEDGVEKVSALIGGHFSSGGQQIQFNFYNREMLLDAKKNPEKYGNLMVRVAGYSAPFISLWDDLQDEIIARTEHSV